MSLLKLIWRQGVVASYRRQFWRQLVGVYRQNPSRLQKYLEKCGMGENLFPIREGLLAKVARSGPGKCRRLNRVTRMALAAGGGKRPHLKQVFSAPVAGHGSPPSVSCRRFPG